MCTPCVQNVRDTQKRVPIAQTLVSFTSVSVKGYSIVVEWHDGQA